IVLMTMVLASSALFLDTELMERVIAASGGNLDEKTFWVSDSAKEGSSPVSFPQPSERQAVEPSSSSLLQIARVETNAPTEANVSQDSESRGKPAQEAEDPVRPRSEEHTSEIQ